MVSTRFLVLIIFVCFTTVLLFCTSCNTDKKGNGVIPEETFVSFYADYMIINQENGELKLDSAVAHGRIDSLYAVYHVTPDQVKQEREELNKDLTQWQSVYEKVISRIETIQKNQKPISPPDSIRR